MYELLFGSVVILTTTYMCHLVNSDSSYTAHGYELLVVDDETDSSSESEFNDYHMGIVDGSPRSCQWSSTTISSDDSEGDLEQDVHLPPSGSYLAADATDDYSSEEAEATDLAEMSWITNPLYEDSGTSA